MSEAVITHRLSSEEFPQLFSVPRPPSSLRALGKRSALVLLERLPEDGLAVVGTRTPQPRALQQLRSTLAPLRDSPLIVLSGLARGVDAEAHLAALDYGLPTIAVLGGGLGRLYPPANRPLAERIVREGGLILTEFEEEQAPRSFFFLLRNRLIAAWSKATWVVQAPLRSGALNTARWARDLDRRCFATPAFPGDPAFAGNQVLLDRDHAEPLWAAHNLGSVWLSLAARPQLPLLLSACAAARSGADHDARSFAASVERLGRTKGHAEIAELFDEFLALEWPPERFFLALRRALELSLVADRAGQLVVHAETSPITRENFKAKQGYPGRLGKI